MSTYLEILRVNHINHIASDYDATLAHYQDLFGGQFLMKIGANDFTDGCLVDVGGEIFELLIPKILDKAEGKQLSKFGPHYQGVEYWVPSKDEAVEAVKARGIGLLYERSNDFLTKAPDTRGVALQIYDGNWHAEGGHWNYTNQKRPESYWRDEHPIGFTGLRQMSFATDDLEGSVAFWLDLTGGRETYRAARPNATATAVGLDIGTNASIPVEIIAPTGEGSLARYIDKYGTRIRATTFGVIDLGRTEKYFASKGIRMLPGDLPDSLMIDPEQNFMAIFQFVE
ncbi:MAG: hypothetical protein AB7L13_17740 [Acidimicrobiia bacterium]